MEITKEQWSHIFKVSKELGIINGNNAVEPDKCKLLCENIDVLKVFYEHWQKLDATNVLRLKQPALHKEHGIVLIKALYTGIAEGQFDHTVAKVIGLDGKELEVKQKDLTPYKDMGETLYGK